MRQHNDDVVFYRHYPRSSSLESECSEGGPITSDLRTGKATLAFTQKHLEKIFRAVPPKGHCQCTTCKLGSFFLLPRHPLLFRGFASLRFSGTTCSFRESIQFRPDPAVPCPVASDSFSGIFDSSGATFSASAGAEVGFVTAS